MFGSPWTEVVALVAAAAVAVLTAPAGISGAVLLLPFQVRVLGTPSPSVTPTNLLYNVVATPGALYRYWRQGQTGGRLSAVLVAGTLPGVIAGSLIRVKLIPGPHVFDLVVAAVLVPLGGWLALSRPAREARATGEAGATGEARATGEAEATGETEAEAATHEARVTGKPRRLTTPVLITLAAAVGCVGGIYGVGGGSILAPILIGSGRRPAEVAPAALASTFVTSVGGVVTFSILSVQQHLPVAPDWPTGIALGVGGLAGGYAGARLQARMPDLLIRRLVGVLVFVIGVTFLAEGIG